MKKIIFCGLLFVATLNSFAAREVLFRDAILFKVDNKIHTLKETLALSKQLSVYNCMVDGSIMLRHLSLRPKNYRSFSKKYSAILNSNKKISIFKDKKLLGNFIDLIKVKTFIKSQNIKVPSEVYIEMHKLGKVNKCFGKSFQLSSIYKELMKMEIYFKSRFYTQTYLVSKADMEQDYKVAFKSDKEKKQYVFKLKRARAINTFVKSLENQITHEENW